MGRTRPNTSQPMFFVRSGAISSVAIKSPAKVPITIQKAEVMQKPFAVA
jgi:hypothetical protein